MPRAAAVRWVLVAAMAALVTAAPAACSAPSPEQPSCGPAPANATLCGYCKDVGSCVYCPVAWGPCKSACGGCFPNGGGGTGGSSGSSGGGGSGGGSCGDSQHAMMSCPDGSSRCCSVNMVCCYDSANNGAIGCEFSGFCQ